MTAKEYLSQAYRLDQRINSNLEEVARLREMASSISAPVLGERVDKSRSPDPPFVRCIMRMMELEEIINRETDMLVALKKQIRTVIEAVPDVDEQMVLRYRYIHNCTWEQIGDAMNADARTVRRWHGEALKHVKVPEQPVQK